MNKTDRKKLNNKGFKILRPKFNAKGYWQICYQTEKGGWAVFKNENYVKKSDCENAIMALMITDQTILIDT